MPAPNDRSRLVHALVIATGLTPVWVYRCLRDGREPANAQKAEQWRQVVAQSRQAKHLALGKRQHRGSGRRRAERAKKGAL